MELKETLLLPSPSFPLKAQVYPELDIYSKGTGKRFILHDGPPFANGEPHLGTALNKILKDICARSATLQGLQVEFQPGWDCHGLPIEMKVSNPEHSHQENRAACRSAALEAVSLQKAVFKALGVQADWDKPYLTMDYTNTVVDVFSKFVERGLVYFAKKPVWWSFGAQTALAQMELEYKQVTHTAAYVAFEHALGDLVAWTTTPWTLAANRAIAVNPGATYILGAFKKPETSGYTTRHFIVSKERANDIPTWELVAIKQTFLGSELIGQSVQAPFTGGVPIIAHHGADPKSGTGIVHIAPGHGTEDYELGIKNNLEIFCPVDGRGKYTSESPICAGEHVLSANVLDLLAKKLVATESITHEYPHCWRTKKPLISIATEQCFINLEKLQARAQKSLDGVQFKPKWGETRLRSTISERKDWCISRQRVWGVPLPVLFDNGNPVLDVNVIRKIRDAFKKYGPDIWYSKSEAELNALLEVPQHYTHRLDTMDVWLDSGVSWIAVLNEAQADLYLEATDQHRGWFQSSLWTAAALDKQAPYKTCVTHGWVVKNKTKFSKSSGFGTTPKELMAKHGPDMVRLWVATRDYGKDMEFNEKELEQLLAIYKKLRGTIRMLEGNIKNTPLTAPDFTPMDFWALSQLQALNKLCQEHYMNYHFVGVTKALQDFCSMISAEYLDRVKDTLYCDATNNPRRVAVQHVCNQMFETLVTLVAPILPYFVQEVKNTTGFDPYQKRFQTLTEYDDTTQGAFLLKKLLLKELEILRETKAITTNASAAVQITPNELEASKMSLKELSEFIGVTDLVVGEQHQVKATDLPKCPRCWNHTQLKNTLCHRCEDVVELLG